MKSSTLRILFAGLLLLGATDVADGQGNCQDIPVVFSLSFTAADGSPTAIYSDGAGGSNPSYVHGVDGVSATIHTCNCNGCTVSNDSILNTLATRKRSIGFDFAGLVDDPYNARPAWTLMPQLLRALLRVNNLLYNYDPNGSYSFTTQFRAQITGPDRSTYHLRFLNPTASAQFLYLSQLNQTLVNTLYLTSLVNVQHSPATGTTPEMWTVSPSQGPPDPGTAATQIGGLLKEIGPAKVHAGQFKAPFFFTITRQ